jgi:hypothetical protein
VQEKKGQDWRTWPQRRRLLAQPVFMIKLAFCLMSAAGLAGEEGTLPLLPPLQPLPQPPLPLLPLPLPTHAEAGAGVGLRGGSSSLTSQIGQ